MHIETPLRPFFGGSRLSKVEDDNRSAFAYIGLPFGSPYDLRGVSAPAAGAPDHVRNMSYEQLCEEPGYYDFDLDGPLMPSGGPPSLIDYGDIAADVRDLEGSKRFATEVVRSALDRGALPLVIGGDHSISSIVVRAYEGLGELNVLHVDAHLDFRDEISGIRDGQSSPVRRIREFPFVKSIVQVGLRGVGSARATEVAEARAAGNTIIKAVDVHDQGISWVTNQMNWEAPWYITIDVDGLDPSIAPATGYPQLGGITYRQACGFIQAIAERGLLAGLDVTEIHAAIDVRGITALTVLRLLTIAMGFSVRGAGREDAVLPMQRAVTP